MKVDKDVQQLERRLSNEGFTKRAPAEVVDEVRSKLEQAKIRQEKLHASRSRIAEAIS